MKKNLPLIAAAIALVIVGGGSYYFIIYRPGEDITTPEKAIKVIAGKLNFAKPEWLSRQNANYLIAWARALRSNSKTFIVDTKTYNSTSGTLA